MVKLVLAAVETDTFKGAMLDGLLKPAFDDLDGLGTTTDATTEDAGTTVAGNLTAGAGACLASGLAGEGETLLDVLLVAGLGIALGMEGAATFNFGLACGLGEDLETGLAAALGTALTAGLPAVLAVTLLGGLAGAVFLDDGASLALTAGLDAFFTTGFVAAFPVFTDFSACAVFARGIAFGLAFATGLATALFAGLAAVFTAALTGFLAALTKGAIFFTAADFFAGVFTSCLLTELTAL